MTQEKIIQLIQLDNTNRWQGIVLGLGSFGNTYELSKDGKWVKYIPNISSN